jgi:hypothetical protein
MNAKTGQALMLLGGVLVALLFVKLMYDMSTNMAQMTGYVGSLSRDVSAMKVSMDKMSGDMAKMRETMEHMDTTIQGMGSPAKQGGKLFQQWNPGEMMR